MRRIPSVIWALLLLGAFYVLFEHCVAPLTGALVGTDAPLPSSMVATYTALAAVAILVFVSMRSDRWQGFVGPVAAFLRLDRTASRGKRAARTGLLVALPVVAGWWGHAQASLEPEPPADPPQIHFNLPRKYLEVTNPLPWTEENIREGGHLYVRHCAPCHGDGQDGNGVFARAWQPKPANFRDPGTIAQLDENYLYWRIKEGGPGLPRNSIEYRSAMPVWDGVLTDDEIWKIIMFEYTSAGQKPAKRGR